MLNVNSLSDSSVENWSIYVQIVSSSLWFLNETALCGTFSLTFFSSEGILKSSFSAKNQCLKFSDVHAKFSLRKICQIESRLFCKIENKQTRHPENMASINNMFSSLQCKHYFYQQTSLSLRNLKCVFSLPLYNHNIQSIQTSFSENCSMFWKFNFLHSILRLNLLCPVSSKKEQFLHGRK